MLLVVVLMRNNRSHVLFPVMEISMKESFLEISTDAFPQMGLFMVLIPRKCVVSHEYLCGDKNSFMGLGLLGVTFLGLNMNNARLAKNWVSRDSMSRLVSFSQVVSVLLF